jgi:hypothetical protein
MLAAMLLDVSILSANEYLVEEIIREEIPDEYLYNDEGELTFASTILDSDNTVAQLLTFLFPKSRQIAEVYRDSNSYVLDLSSHKNQLIDFNYLEIFYPKWLEDTGRENTMNEYGMLIDFIGFARKGLDKKNLLMVVTNRQHRS